MTPYTILSVASELNVSICNNGDRIIARGDEQSVQSILPLLRIYKDLLAKYFLDEKDFYLFFYQERAAIYEYEGGSGRSEAEVKALNDLIQIYADKMGVDVGSKQVNQFINQFMTEVNYV